MALVDPNYEQHRQTWIGFTRLIKYAMADDHSHPDRAGDFHFVTGWRPREGLGCARARARLRPAARAMTKTKKSENAQGAEPPFLPYAVGREAADKRDRQAGARRGGEEAAATERGRGRARRERPAARTAPRRAHRVRARAAGPHCADADGSQVSPGLIGSSPPGIARDESKTPADKRPLGNPIAGKRPDQQPVPRRDLYIVGGFAEPGQPLEPSKGQRCGDDGDDRDHRSGPGDTGGVRGRGAGPSAGRRSAPLSPPSRRAHKSSRPSRPRAASAKIVWPERNQHGARRQKQDRKRDRSLVEPGRPVGPVGEKRAQERRRSRARPTPGPSRAPARRASREVSRRGAATRTGGSGKRKPERQRGRRAGPPPSSCATE